MIEYLKILNDCRHALVLELNENGLIWEFAKVSGFIKINDDGTSIESENAYLKTFTDVHTMTETMIEMVNSEGDILKVPVNYIGIESVRNEMKAEFIRKKELAESRKKELEQKEKNKMDAINKVKELATEHDFKVSIL